MMESSKLGPELAGMLRRETLDEERLLRVSVRLSPKATAAEREKISDLLRHRIEPSRRVVYGKLNSARLKKLVRLCSVERVSLTKQLNLKTGAKP